MFHARIVTKSGSMYLAAEGDPYDMENLHQHMLQMKGSPQNAVRLEIAFDPSSETRRLLALVERWKTRGIEVILGGKTGGGGARARRGYDVEPLPMPAPAGETG